MVDNALYVVQCLVQSQAFRGHLLGPTIDASGRGTDL